MNAEMCSQSSRFRCGHLWKDHERTKGAVERTGKCVQHVTLTRMEWLYLFVRTVSHRDLIFMSASPDPTDDSKVKPRTNKRYTPAGHRGSSLAFYTYHSRSSISFLIRPQPKSAPFTLLLRYNHALIDLVICWDNPVCYLYRYLLPALQHYILSFISPPTLPRPRRAQHLTSTPHIPFPHVSDKSSFPHSSGPPQPAAHPPHSEASHRAHGCLPRPPDE